MFYYRAHCDRRRASISAERVTKRNEAFHVASREHNTWESPGCLGVAVPSNLIHVYLEFYGLIRCLNAASTTIGDVARKSAQRATSSIA